MFPRGTLSKNMETLSSCPICSCPVWSPFLQCKDHTVSNALFQIVRCDGCGFLFTNPRPPASAIAKYYESDDYISHSGTKKDLKSRLYHLVRRYTVGRKVKLLNRLVPSPERNRRVLDIGCGTGDFLSACQKNGWEAYGVEPNVLARKSAEEEKGLKVMSALSDWIPVFEQDALKFDVICLWHVLEHIHDLQQTLKTLFSLLNPGGKVLLALPNSASWDAQHYQPYWAAYDLPRHLYHFQPKDVRKLAGMHSKNVLQVLPMPFDAYYVSLLSEKYARGKTSFVRSFWKGWKSNRFAAKNKECCSSQIYVLADPEV